MHHYPFIKYCCSFINVPKQNPIVSISKFWLSILIATLLATTILSPYATLIFNILTLCVVARISFDQLLSAEKQRELRITTIFHLGKTKVFMSNKFYKNLCISQNPNSRFPGVGHQLDPKPSYWRQSKLFITKQIAFIKPYITQYRPLYALILTDTKEAYIIIGLQPLTLSLMLSDSNIAIFTTFFIFNLQIELSYPQLGVLLAFGLLLSSSPVFFLPLALVMHSSITSMPYLSLTNLITKKYSYKFMRTLTFLPQFIFCRYLLPSLFVFSPNNMVVAAGLLIIDAAEYLTASPNKTNNILRDGINLATSKP